MCGGGCEGMRGGKEEACKKEDVRGRVGVRGGCEGGEVCVLGLMQRWFECVIFQVVTGSTGTSGDLR